MCKNINIKECKRFILKGYYLLEGLKYCNRYFVCYEGFLIDLGGFFYL